MSNFSAEEYRIFIDSSDDDKRKSPNYVAYLSFMRMGIKPDLFDQRIASFKVSPREDVSASDFETFKTLSDNDKRKHPNYVFYSSLIKMGK